MKALNKTLNVFEKITECKRLGQRRSELIEKLIFDLKKGNEFSAKWEEEQIMIVDLQLEGLLLEISNLEEFVCKERK